MEEVDVPNTTKRVNFKTRNVQLYHIENVKPTIKDMKTEFELGFHKSLERITGSNWAIKRIDSLFAITHTLKAARGSSYIPTPAKWAHPKCGLINIQNHDQECVRWCMLYHQSEKGKDTQNHSTSQTKR